MDFFQTLASMASIISIPLAVYFARKNNNTTSEKARLDIIKTLSYRLSAAHTITREDINSVYKSKLREHGIIHAQFSQEDILNDLKSDIMSNAFLENDTRNNILYNLSSIEFVKMISNPIPRFLIPFARLFISPIPYILLIINTIICIILLCPYIFNMIFHCIEYGYLSNSYLQDIFISIFHYDIFLYISLICLLILSVTCFFRKKYLKNVFNIS